jgi:hypothetical protein
VPDEEPIGTFTLPKPPKSRETNMNFNLGSGKANSSSTTTNLKSIFRMEKSNEVFRTSASSYEGVKSHYTSNNEVIAISTFSPKEDNNTQEDEARDSVVNNSNSENNKIALNSFKEENNLDNVRENNLEHPHTDITSDKSSSTLSLLNNIKLLN